MIQTRDKILSASRRTDIPGWYTPWFLDQIRQGYFVVKNPYTKISRKVGALPDQIHSIVFWSKNFGPFLSCGAEQTLVNRGYNLFFNFTINSRSSLLEPGLPPLLERLDQAAFLCDRFGPDKLFWRFDPLCYFQIGQGPIQNNLTDFFTIADAMAALGITRCVTSFYDPYKKIKTRTRSLSLENQVSFLLPEISDQEKLLRQMAGYLESLNIDLHLCCEKTLFEKLGAQSAIRENSCIDGRHLQTLYGGRPQLARDYGQRSKKGCRCTKSIDIGSYEDHPCFHNCLFCYATTGMDLKIRQDNPK